MLRFRAVVLRNLDFRIKLRMRSLRFRVGTGPRCRQMPGMTARGALGGSKRFLLYTVLSPEPQTLCTLLHPYIPLCIPTYPSISLYTHTYPYIPRNIPKYPMYTTRFYCQVLGAEPCARKREAIFNGVRFSV